jgi:hypothetical protein
MPIVPRVARQVTTAPLPGVRRQAAETPLSEGAGVAEARAQSARALASVSGQVAGVGLELYAQHEAQARADAAIARQLDAETQLNNFELGLSTPGGALTVQGRDALGATSKALADYTTLVGTIEASLPEDQRARFAATAEQRRRSIGLSLERHAASAVQAADADTLNARVQSGVALAVTHARDPERLGQDLAGVTAALTAAAPAQGWSAETLAAKIAAARSDVHVGVISRLLDDGDDRLARAYFDETKDQIDGARIGAVEQALSVASTAADGQRRADAILATTATRAEALAQLAGIDDVKLRDETRARVLQGLADREKAASDAHEQALTDAANVIDRTGRTAAVSPAAWATFSVAERRSLQIYAEAKAAGVEPRTNWEVYSDLFARATSRDPSVQQTFAEEPLLKYRGQLADQQFTRLLELQASLRGRGGTSPTVVREATIDSDTFNAIASGAGLTVFGSPSATDKARVAQLRASVEDAIDHEQQARGRALTRDEKRTLMQGLIDRHVQLNVWGTDPTYPAAAVLERERASAYVPLDQIPAVSRTEFIHYLKSVSPTAAALTPEAITARFRDRIERAYAALVMGLGDQAVIDRLEGR